jgi:hypothetical protein
MKINFSSFLVALAMLLGVGMNAQVNSTVQIPTATSTGLTSNSGPTARFKHQRIAYILPASDFTGKFGTNTTVSALQLPFYQGAATATPTTVTVYLANTTDATYSKGTVWPTIITGMTQSYSGSVTVPTAAGNVNIALTTPFTYTGGSVYVAIDAVVPGTVATTPATIFGNDALATGAVRYVGATTRDTLAATAFRPCLNFIFPNPTTNDMAVAIVDGIIKTPIIGGNKDVIAVISNKSNATRTNVVVTLNVTGANTYTTSKTISSIAAGVDSLVTFTGFNPTALGLNNITVSVPADQVTSNNSLPFSMYTTCADYSWSSGRTASIGTLGSVSGTITNAGVWKNQFPNASTLTLYGVNVAISNDPNAIGKVLTAYAYGANGTTTLAQSVGVTITAADTSTLKYFSFPSPVTVTTDFFVGVSQPAATVAYRPFLYSPGFGIFSYLNTASLGAADRSFSSLGIRGNLIIDPVVSPKITATSTNARCNGGTGTGLVALTPASSLYSYRWSNNATTASAALTANTYTVTATYATSCSLTASATITQPSAITVTALVPTNPRCNGQLGSVATPTVTGGTAGYTYRWSNNVTTASLTGLTAGTYGVVVSDANACTAISNTVTIAAAPSAITVTAGVGVGTNPRCNGGLGSILAPTVTGGTAGYTYRWSNNATTAAITGVRAGTYTLVVTDANACTASSAGTITEPSAITVTISNSVNTATANVTGGTSGYTYNWSGPVTGTTTNPTVTLTASTAVTVVVTDANSCTATQIANVVSGVENTSNSTLSVYPNPTTGKVTIGLTTANQQDAVNITVFNAVGQSVAVSANKVSANQYELDFSNLNAAVYTVRINVGSEVITRTVVLNK